MVGLNLICCDVRIRSDLEDFLQTLARKRMKFLDKFMYL